MSSLVPMAEYERVEAERDTLRARVDALMGLLAQRDDQIQALRAQIESLDCRLAGRVAELSGSHCPADNPCDRCVAERRIEELSHAYAVQGLAIEDLTNERDRYRALLELTK